VLQHLRVDEAVVLLPELLVVREPEAAGEPQAAVDRLTSVTIGGYVVPISVDVGILLVFSAVTLAIAMRSFRHRD